jgi:hypothetical protein
VFSLIRPETSRNIDPKKHYDADVTSSSDAAQGEQKVDAEKVDELSPMQKMKGYRSFGEIRSMFLPHSPSLSSLPHCFLSQPLPTSFPCTISLLNFVFIANWQLHKEGRLDIRNPDGKLLPRYVFLYDQWYSQSLNQMKDEMK